MNKSLVVPEDLEESNGLSSQEGHLVTLIKAIPKD